MPVKCDKREREKEEERERERSLKTFDIAKTCGAKIELVM